MCWQAVLLGVQIAASGTQAAKNTGLFGQPEEASKTTPDVSAPGPLFPNPGNFTDFLMRQGAVGANPFSGAWASGGFGGE